MALQFSTTVRDALLDVIESTIGTSAVLKLFDGTLPANCGTADAGTVVASMSLQSDWMAASSSGSKAKSGTWSDASADATGTVDYFRLYASNGTTCHMQGTVTATGGGGDLTLDNVSVASAQVVTITGFTLTAPGV
jgi:mono/diheme cytochrome c family protein